jgi:hypothetical protein
MNAEKTRGMALAYIDARDVQDRLNQVCGPFWQTRHPWASGTLIACEIGIKLGPNQDDEWAWRGDGAGEIENETTSSGERKEQAQDMARKAAFSDSFKRAAVRWGVGRYLYDIDSPWVEIEARGRSFVIPDRELARLRGMLSGKGGLSPRFTPSSELMTRDTTSVTAPRGTSSTDDDDAIARRVVDARDRIADALRLTDDQVTPQQVLDSNTADLLLILKHAPKTHARILAYAEERKAQLARPELADRLREGLIA